MFHNSQSLNVHCDCSNMIIINHDAVTSNPNKWNIYYIYIYKYDAGNRHATIRHTTRKPSIARSQLAGGRAPHRCLPAKKRLSPSCQLRRWRHRTAPYHIVTIMDSESWFNKLKTKSHDVKFNTTWLLICVWAPMSKEASSLAICAFMERCRNLQNRVSEMSQTSQ